MRREKIKTRRPRGCQIEEGKGRERKEESPPLYFLTSSERGGKKGRCQVGVKATTGTRGESNFTLLSFSPERGETWPALRTKTVAKSEKGKRANPLPPALYLFVLGKEREEGSNTENFEVLPPIELGF